MSTIVIALNVHNVGSCDKHNVARMLASYQPHTCNDRPLRPATYKSVCSGLSSDDRQIRNSPPPPPLKVCRPPEPIRHPPGALPTNFGRLDRQVRTPGNPTGRAHERLQGIPCVPPRPRLCRHHPHHSGEMGQRHTALEGARLLGGYVCLLVGVDFRSDPRHILAYLRADLSPGRPGCEVLQRHVWSI